MTWKTFIADIASETQICIVGPLYKNVHIAQFPTIYVDGGAASFDPRARSQVPTITVGDGDSTEVPMDVVLPKKKDYSDLAFVLMSLPKTIRHIDLLGFLGGRRDHELIGFGEVHHFLLPRKKFTSARFDESVIAISAGSVTQNIHGRFSVVVFETCEVTITGACSYPLMEPTELNPVSSVGLSNEGFGQVIVACTKPCFIFLG